MQQPNLNCYLEYGPEGIWLNTDQMYEDDDPMVIAEPDLFDEVLILDGGTP